ncbi:hypothetical protein [Massilia consociata]|uniref:Uncharacterized protein n=1 Tax=Massilia consociata TaxID=760117 RepID=A0ABV6FJY0_9BURK
MNRFAYPALACIAACPLPPSFAAQPAPRAPAQTPVQAATPDALPLRARLTDEVIEQAVRDTLAEQPALSRNTGQALGAEPYREFSRRVDEAKLPGCLGPDALRHQPARIGPIVLGGLAALPFWAAAVVRGKCR